MGTDRVALQTIWSTEISALSDGPHTEQVEPYDPCPEENRLTLQVVFGAFPLCRSGGQWS
jgi:hypothetical protein